MDRISIDKCFDGKVEKYEIQSVTLQSKTRFNIFIPADKKPDTPCIIFLAGLTCNEDTFVTKSGICRLASEKGVIIVAPDTSPRNVEVPPHEDDYDFGFGASFYVDSTVDGWKNHFNMYSYIVDELYELLLKEFKIDKDKISIMGHSMGGHGALIIGLRNQHKFRSISCFAPIANPSNCDWGRKCLAGYLGHDRRNWKLYDSIEILINEKNKIPIKVTQGKDDMFLKTQLCLDQFDSLIQNGYDIDLEYKNGYDHSYWFIQTFLEEHIDFHLKHY